MPTIIETLIFFGLITSPSDVDLSKFDSVQLQVIEQASIRTQQLIANHGNQDDIKIQYIIIEDVLAGNN